jgi:glycosyltransferase involved in cell wall biosynthesis
MRVAVDGRELRGRPTGAGKALGWLLRRLGTDVPAVACTVLAPEACPGWRLRRRMLWEQVELPWHARRLGADVLHVPAGPGPLWHPMPLVMTVHDLAPLRCPELLPHARSRWYWGRWVLLTARRAHAVIVPSEATRADLVGAGVSAERVAVIPLAAALETAASPPDGADRAVMARYALPRRYLLYVGTIDRRKDYRSLLGALEHLDADLGLVVAGTLIAGRTDFEARLADAGLSRRVRVLGYVPEADLGALYRGAEALVYPSWYEGFGLPVLEAMACGTPVITYRATALPEVAGDAALLVDPPWSAERLAAAIRRVLEDDALRTTLRARGRARAAAFDWGRTARLTAEVYARAARRR